MFASLLRSAPIPQAKDSPPPQPLTEVDLNRIAPQFVGPVYRIGSLDFSPDENWIAVGVLVPDREAGPPPRYYLSSSTNFLFLLPLHGPPQSVAIDPGISFHVTWSPDSQKVLVQGVSRLLHKGLAKLYDLAGKELWTRDGLSAGDLPQVFFGGIYGFLDAQHLLVRRSPAKSKPAGIDTTDLDGNVTAAWNVPTHWRVVDVNSDRRRLLVFPDEENSQTLVVDYDSRKVLQRKENPASSPESGVHGGTFEYFAEDGKSLCSVGSVGNPSYPLARNTYTQCWDADTGKRIAAFRRFLGGAPAAASARASRLLLTNNPILTARDGRVMSYPSLRVVWDFRSVIEVASWRPRLMATSATEMAGPVALSPSGHSIAEGAGPTLVISSIP